MQSHLRKITGPLRGSEGVDYRASCAVSAPNLAAATSTTRPRQTPLHMALGAANGFDVVILAARHHTKHPARVSGTGVETSALAVAASGTYGNQHSPLEAT
jgi:hypothetical protein